MSSKLKYKLLLLIGTITLSVSCTQLPKGQYDLKGTIQGVDGENIYLSYMVEDSIKLIDSVRVQNSMFTFSDKLEKPYQVAYLYMGDLMNYRNPRRMRIYLEPKLMTIAIDTARFAQPVVTGSFTQSQFDSLNSVINKIDDEMRIIRQTIKNEADINKQKHLENKLELYREQRHQTYIDFIRSNPNSYLSADNLLYLLSSVDYVQLKELYENLSDNVKLYGNVKQIENEIEALKATQPGQIAPDFIAMGVDGSPIRFSEVVKDKYVILDFWASWCIPCRKSMPHLKELYSKYKDKGLTIFCVADNDKSEKNWHDAIKKDETEEFFHVYYDLESSEGYNKNISNKYAIHYLPTKFLIDRNFKIVGKFDDAELDAKLKEVFGE